MAAAFSVFSCALAACLGGFIGSVENFVILVILCKITQGDIHYSLEITFACLYLQFKTISNLT